MVQAVTNLALCFHGNVPNYMGMARVVNKVTGVTGAVDGAFTPTGAIIPGDLADLRAHGALGETTGWTATWYCTLGDGSTAHWDGDSWEAEAAT